MEKLEDATLEKEKEHGIKNPKLSRKLFVQIAFEDVQVPITLPPFKKPETLATILSAIFGGRGVQSSNTDSSSGSDRDSPRPKCDFIEEDWSKVLSEDGHLYLDKILPQLPAALPMTESELGLYAQSLSYASEGLALYNAKNKGAEFKLVAPLLSHCFCNGGIFNATHCNFLAKRKRGSSTSQTAVKLFFVEEMTGRDNPKFTCCMLEPICPSADPGTTEALEILHPPDIICSACYEDEEGYDSD